MKSVVLNEWTVGEHGKVQLIFTGTNGAAPKMSAESVAGRGPLKGRKRSPEAVAKMVASKAAKRAERERLASSGSVSQS